MQLFIISLFYECNRSIRKFSNCNHSGLVIALASTTQDITVMLKLNKLEKMNECCETENNSGWILSSYKLSVYRFHKNFQNLGFDNYWQLTF